ncbi:MAG: hypothetical protein HZA03_02425 [Nitrospinae bacterium]|nr:hypothetical protein [Nitrospinota bacterium]
MMNSAARRAVLKSIVIYGLTALLLSHCSEFSTSDTAKTGNAQASVTLKLPKGVSLKPGGQIAQTGNKRAATITAITISVSAADMTTITQPVSLTTLDATIDVPVGAARTFTALVKTDIGGSFTGSHTTDVSGSALSVSISMAINSALISGKLSAAVSKPGLKAAISTWAGAVVEVFDSTGALVGTGTAAADGTYSVDVPDGANYFVRAQIGNMVLKAYVPSTSGATAVSVNTTSTAAVMVLAQSLGVANLGDSGVSGTAAIAAANISTLYASILADPNLAVAAAALESEITASYDPNGTTLSVGSAGTAGASSISLIVSAVAPPSTTTVSPPAAPTGVWVSAGNAQAFIGWTAVTGATSYNVYYRASVSGVTTANGTKVTGATNGGAITGLTNGTTYYFIVTAVGAGGESATSSEVSATPQVPAPAAPTGVTATSGDSRVTISWNAVSGATLYHVYWSVTPGVAGSSIWLGGTSYTHTPLTNGIPYYYKVTAENAAGEGTASVEVRGIPGAGVAWAGRTSGTANILYAVASSGTGLAAVGAGTTLRTSPDGIAWTTRPDPTTWGYDMFGVVWGGTQFVTGGVAGTLLTSPTGAAWTLQTFSTANDINGLAWNGTQFVAVGAGGTAEINTSPNGITWTARTPSTANLLKGVTWGGAQFVAVGAGGTVVTSPDGIIIWTNRTATSGTTELLAGVACSPAICVAIGSAVGPPYYTIVSSPDGITWTPRTSTATSALNAVNWNGTQFVAVGAVGTILTSPDGITWTAQTSGTANALNGITWDGTQYVAVGAAGTILVSHSPFMGGAIQKQLASGGVVTTYAGAAGVTGSTDTGTGPATLARFNWPDGITTDGTNLYVADTVNNTIRKVVISTGAVTTLAGTALSAGSTDGAGIGTALFNFPRGITTDGTNLYVVDGGNHTIRQVVISTGVVTTLAGSAGLTGSADGTGVAARFNFPEGITTDGTNLYVADGGNKTIRKIVISTGAVTTLAGTALVTGSADGTGAAASFSYPKGITTDGTNLYVADFNGPTIRKVVISTGVVTTLAGTAGTNDDVDGIGAAAAFYGPQGITTDGTNLYVTDYWNHNVRKIVIASTVVTTLAGSTLLSQAQGSTDGTGTAALFKGPYGITTDGTSLYVMDTGNHTIRKIQ